MKSFFSPAIAMMNRMGYTGKFALLWLMALASITVLASSLFISLNKEISSSRRELEGLALIAPISRTVQAIQQHRGWSAMYLAGNEAARGKHDAVEKIAIGNFDAMAGMLPPKLKESEGWGRIKAGWELLQKDEFGMTAGDNLAAHTRLIYDLLFFEVAVADEYALTLDSQLDSYYLIDTAISKLPAVLEHIGQLRAHGASMLAARQVSEEQKTGLYKIMGMLADVVEASDVNLAKTIRYNPAMGELLSPVSGTLTDAANRVTGLMESDIFAGRFAQSPDDFFALATLALEEGYRQTHESLLPAIEALLKARIARAENTLYASTGAALLLLLVVGYFSAGIYFSITGNIRSLAGSASTFAAGDMRERIRLDTRDELGQVGDSFNEMADGFSAILAEQKRTQQELQQNQALLNEAQRLGHLGSWELNHENGNLRWSDEIYRIFELDPVRFSPSYKNFLGAIHPDDRDAVNQAYLQSLQDRQPYDATHRLLLADGRIKWVHEHCTSDFDASGKPLRSVGAVQDITERKLAEEKLQKYNDDLKAINHQLQDTQNQLMQSEKMASIGQLAAGVAHEINNPIGYVYSNLGTLEKYVQGAIAMIEKYEVVEKLMTDEVALARLQSAKDKLDIAFLKEDLSALMSESRDGITRVKHIVQNLKDFSHVDASDEWHFADLHKGLDSTLNIASNEIKYKASVVKEYGDIPDVECLSSQLNQVFMNLLVNAAHAIEERGTITVRTGTEGEQVWVEVADTGKGVKPEHLNKIFDPFFTTKPIGKGTGLGLSLSYGIIKKHGGRIEVQSEVGRGTTFRVWLPVRQPQKKA